MLLEAEERPLVIMLMVTDSQSQSHLHLQKLPTLQPQMVILMNYLLHRGGAILHMNLKS
ncbi:hypothetical protein PPACK8108_LOCUS3164 [Phakopsora pachyrhizi]|uniref:Uncharacterized protein n=1 Tax=Phakopsora pachyrhizi TaxID=170000 RepID=A0AAV0AL16_PHAPC|nr:hypothetical protein PPACK8108_LOCUS3164 [Phakopsora pachyrhizi]